MRRPAGAVVVGLVLLGACTGGDDAGPSPTTQPTTSTSLVDLTGIDLPGVGGETTTTIDETGTARLIGTVTGPGGPVAGATVRIDRLVAGREIRKDVVTAADGRWELKGVPGGRYRVRAFLAPTLAQTRADVQFLDDGEEHVFDLRLEDQRGAVVRADVAPDQPTVDGDVNLVVLVVQRTVTADGIVASTPLAGAFVELTGLGRWQLRGDQAPDDGSTPTTFFDESTDTGQILSDGGRASFALRCLQAGAPGLGLRVPVVGGAGPSSSGSTTSTTESAATTEVVALELPDCADRPAGTTSTTAGSSTSSTVL